MANEIVPFGKYKGKPVELMLTDQDYLQWIQGQPGLMQKLQQQSTTIFNLIMVGAPQTDDTPEHNKLQARFVDPAFQIAFLRALHNTSFRDVSVSFEHGYDVRILFTYPRKAYDDSIVPTRAEHRVEIKPQMGDDFPSVLRQMRLNTADILLLGAFNASVAFEHVQAMFHATSGVTRTVSASPNNSRITKQVPQEPIYIRMLSDVEKFLT